MRTNLNYLTTKTNNQKDGYKNQLLSFSEQACQATANHAHSNETSKKKEMAISA